MIKHIHAWINKTPIAGQPGMYQWQCKCGKTKLGGKPIGSPRPRPPKPPTSL